MPTVPAVFVVDDHLSVRSSLKFLIGNVGAQVESCDSAGRIPVVFITAHDDEATRLRALKGGAVDLLPKPVRGEALLRAAHLVLQQ